MKITVTIIIAVFSHCCFGQMQGGDELLAMDNIIHKSCECLDCHIIKDSLRYKKLKCGLYLSSKGDIAYQTRECIDEQCDTAMIRYVNWIYGVVEGDSINGGLKEMKFVVDIRTFKFVDHLYWWDKNYVYCFTPMSDGGTVCLNEKIDRQSFVVFKGTGYAKDKSHVFYRGDIIPDADIKTFRVMKGHTDLAYDIKNIYSGRVKLNDKEVKEYKLEKYRNENGL